MTEEDKRTRLERLEPLVGEWRVEAPGLPFPSELADAARTTFEWTLGGAFLLQRTSIPVPEAPDSLSVIGLDAGDGYTQHYFDSRGIARLYAMTFDGRDWTLERHAPDFSPLPFHQRWRGTLSAGGDTIEGRWEKSPDGRDWELDFELTYRLVDYGDRLLLLERLDALLELLDRLLRLHDRVAHALQVVARLRHLRVERLQPLVERSLLSAQGVEAVSRRAPLETGLDLLHALFELAHARHAGPALVLRIGEQHPQGDSQRDDGQQADERDGRRQRSQAVAHLLVPQHRLGLDGHGFALPQRRSHGRQSPRRSL